MWQNFRTLGVIEAINNVLRVRSLHHTSSVHLISKRLRKSRRESQQQCKDDEENDQHELNAIPNTGHKRPATFSDTDEHQRLEHTKHPKAPQIPVQPILHKYYRGTQGARC